MTETDMIESETRNDYGLPPVADFQGHNNRGNINQAVDNSEHKNDALPWVFIAGIIAAVSLGGWIASLDRISDVNERAARAEERADLLQYYLMELDGKLMQRQLIKPEESFAGQMRAREQAKQAEKPEE